MAAAPPAPADILALLDAPAGAYVHVPFCARICPFCPYDKVVPRPGQPERYFAALRTEVERYLDAGAGPFTSLYVGGGTPTLFPELLADVVALLPATGERAIEVLPTHGTPSRLDALAAMGFTAVSIGAQSFSDDVLHHLRRPHDAAAARAAVVAAVGRFALVDVDLIVDVEFDDAHAGAFLRDLTTCLEVGVDQVSTYPLMRFGYTPFGRARHDRRREHEVLAEATRIAAAHGYERRSVWTFNRRESASYTSITRRRFLGFGASSASFLGRDHLLNHFGVETYIAAVEAGRAPVARHFHLGAPGGLAYDAFWQAYAGRTGRPSWRRRTAAGPRPCGRCCRRWPPSASSAVTTTARGPSPRAASRRTTTSSGGSPTTSSSRCGRRCSRSTTPRAPGRRGRRRRPRGERGSGNRWHALSSASARPERSDVE